MEEMNNTLQEFRIIQTIEQQKDAYTLWHLCFGDSKEYMDNYFAWRLKENQVLALYDNEVLTSMVHLNPYPIILRGKELKVNYIVGVATRLEYRKKGLMRRLLEKALRDMYHEGQEFTYLMPASEAIYLPFDFRFVYEQNRRKLQVNRVKFLTDLKEEQGQEELQVAMLHNKVNTSEYKLSDSLEVSLELPVPNYIYNNNISYQVLDCCDKKALKKLISFVNSILSDTQEIYAKRDAQYYKRLQADMRSAGGEVLLFYKEDEIIGCISYMLEGNYGEVTETIIEEVYTAHIINRLKNILIYHWFNRLKQVEKDKIASKNHQEQFEITMLESNYLDDEILEATGFEKETKPIIMARIVNLSKFMLHVTAKKPLSIIIKVEDSIIQENQGTWEYQFLLEEKKNFHCEIHSTNKPPELTLDMAVFTEIFFGYKEVDELDKKNISVVTLNKLKEINFFHKIYLNEIV